MPELTTRDTVLHLVQSDPHITATQIAKEAGVTRQRVEQILDSLGYELVWRRRPGRRPA